MAEEPIVVEATHEQWLQSRKQSYHHWGKGLSEEAYLLASQQLSSFPFASEGRMTRWVLVPSSDPTTLNFYCSCEIYLRPVYVSKQSGQVENGYCQAISAVFTPDHHRRKGYASKLMTDLHLKLQEKGKATGHEVVLSILYSDVGDFYTRCGQGWDPHSPRSTYWTVEVLSALDSLPSSSPEPVSITTTEEIYDVCRHDARLLQQELPTQSRKDKQAVFALVPTGQEVEWQNGKASLIAGHLGKTNLPTTWGVEVGKRGEEGWAFALYLPTYYASELVFHRLRCDSAASFTSILKHALGVARDQGMRKIQIWNFKEEWASELPEGLRGESKDRDGALPSVAWYLDMPEGGIEWVVNEKINYC
ncbi:hypothetical protein BT69DRAFT_1282484 [Atractiella rhizophila]|nr:hypothetical protein BT69DRAFT_1282484 [Atractiella rhizophila]